MTKITPFSIAFLCELAKREHFRAELVSVFPQLAQWLDGKGFTDRKAAIESLKGSEWERWVERKFEQMEDAANIVQHFHGSIQFYKDRMAQFASQPEQTKEQAMLKTKSQMELVGPQLWKWLHKAALDWSGDPKDLLKILQFVTNAVPCGECKNHWLKMIQEVPPKCTTPMELFAQTVDWHNRVNERTNKPIMSVEDALKLYVPVQLTDPAI